MIAIVQFSVSGKSSASAFPFLPSFSHPLDHVRSVGYQSRFGYRKQNPFYRILAQRSVLSNKYGERHTGKKCMQNADTIFLRQKLHEIWLQGLMII